jgi:hypothetical protein
MAGHVLEDMDTSLTQFTEARMMGLVGLVTKRLPFFVRVSTPIYRVRRCGAGILSADDVGGWGR